MAVFNCFLQQKVHLTKLLTLCHVWFSCLKHKLHVIRDDNINNSVRGHWKMMSAPIIKVCYKAEWRFLIASCHKKFIDSLIKSLTLCHVWFSCLKNKSHVTRDIKLITLLGVIEKWHQRENAKLSTLLLFNVIRQIVANYFLDQRLSK